MNYYISRIASFLLAFGFFFGCTLLQKSSNSQTDAAKLSKKQISRQIKDLDKQLSGSDSTASMLYRKGDLLIRLAKKKEVEERLSTYHKAHNTLTKSAHKYEQAYANADNNQALELLNVSWSNEHNKGVQITQNDSVLSSADYKRAGQHFHNATTIIPDSATSYKLGARAYYQAQEPDKAISLLEEAQQQVSKVPLSVLDQLGYLYLQNDQPQKGVKTYQQAMSLFGQNTNIIHGLSNAYIANNDHAQAVKLLEKLVKQKSGNIIYKQSLATELYYLGAQKVNNWINSQSKISLNNFDDVDSLLLRSKRLFDELVNNNQKNPDIKKQAAQFYFNNASVYQKLQKQAINNADSTIRKRIDESLTKSLPLHKRLTAKHPDNETYWQNLYQIYTYLGMKEEALNIKSNF